MQFGSISSGFVPEDIQRLPNSRKSACLIKRDAKHDAERVKRMDALTTLVGKLEVGVTYHLLTSGDIDAGTVLDLVAHTAGPFDQLYLSTWSMERSHINMLEEHVRSGRLKGLTILTGDYFAQRSPDNYTRLVHLCRDCQGRLYRLNNHSKIMALRNPATGFSAVIEGSANFTRNPRVENCCITIDGALYDHVAKWFEENIDGRNPHIL